MPKIAVVILNWNGKEFLERFLKGVIQNSQTKIADVEIIVADNGSQDDSVDYMLTHFKQIRLIILEQNYGFTGGYNRALEQIEADYFLLLNSDIEVTPAWIDPLCQVMEQDRTIAACQPKIRSYKEPDHFEYAGACGGFIDTLGYPFCRGRLLAATEKDHGQYDTTREIFWATGAALMVRADLYRSSGGLDENFFAHMEEIDLCWRFKRQGYRIMVCPDSVVYHVGGGTLPAWSPRKTYLNFRNNIAMLYKNLSTPRFVAVLGFRLGSDTLRMLSYLVMGKFDFVRAIFDGHRDFWRMRPKLDRQKQFGFHKVGQIYRGSIVVRYLFHKTFDKLM